MKISTDPSKIGTALSRGVDKIYPSAEELKKILVSGKKMKIYCGYDPSSPHLHIGHTVTLRKLAQFQLLGHEIIMLVGDFTGMIGDPTDKAAARKKLSRKEVLQNAKNYKKVASKILNFQGANPAKVLFNSQWLDKISFADLIELSSHFTVQQMIVREMFQERIKQNKPIYLHEFLYPLAQAYDSVALGVDLEVGGTDQTFNMLCGRELAKSLKNKEKLVLTMKLLTDPLGKKMGKTEGNAVNLDEKPKEMYGKIMAWPDGFILPGFELLTDRDLDDVKKIKNPREAKARLATEIVRLFHGETAAEQAESEFNRIFRDKKLPSSIPEVSIEPGEINIIDLFTRTGLAVSRSEAKRLITQRGASINNQTQTDWREVVVIKKGDVIRLGRRKFAKIK